jgi:hypothetical protein
MKLSFAFLQQRKFVCLLIEFVDRDHWFCQTSKDLDTKIFDLAQANGGGWGWLFAPIPIFFIIEFCFSLRT